MPLVSVLSMRRMLVAAVLVHVGFLLGFFDASLGASSSSVDVVEVLSGSQARLPCTALVDGKNPTEIRWWKVDSQRDGRRQEPLYTVDAGKQGVALVQAEHRILPAWRERLHFSVARAALSLRDAQPEDSGIYQCEVRFVSAKSRSATVRLQTVVPPEPPVLKAEDGALINTTNGIGALDEGKPFSIFCEPRGGIPRPSLSWQLLSSNGSELQLDNTSAVSSSPHLREGAVWARMARLERMHEGARLSCLAANANVSTPSHAELLLSLNLRPVKVTIKGQRGPISADVSAQVECEVTGSRPSAQIMWWLDGTRLRDTNDGTSPDVPRGVYSQTSILRWTPSSADNGKTLACRAVNRNFPQSNLEDTWMVEVHYKPSVELRLGAGLDPSGVREGHDAYFECSVEANPPVREVAWRLNGKAIGGPGGRAIQGPMSLALRGVTIEDAGNYTCVASNSAGHGTSNAVPLTVKYTPQCSRSTPRVFAASLGEDVRVDCIMNAEPAEVAFSWTINGTSGPHGPRGRPLYSFTRDGLKSTLTYVLKSPEDYGTLRCSAYNALGEASTSCSFQVVPATVHPPASAKGGQSLNGPASPLANCSIWNVTASAVQVTCLREPWSSTRLAAEARPLSPSGPVLPVTASSNGRTVWLRDLASGSPFEVSVFAELGASGRTRLATLTTHTLPAASAAVESAERRRLKTAGSAPASSPSPGGCCSLAVALGAGAGVLLALPAAVVAALRLRTRCPRRKKRRRRRSPEIDVPK
ncbi:synaptogenesis protein syg-2-like [Ornithodoros turicata]|uniref:synaptogenesis protein syg-2-like n=1 Tax=Ornithodoros turicata TaxID=34597 RepID=UPI00313990EE